MRGSRKSFLHRPENIKHQNLTENWKLFQSVAQLDNLPVEHLIQCCHAGSPSSLVQPPASCRPCWAPPPASCRPRRPRSPHRCAAYQASLPSGCCWIQLAAFFNYFFLQICISMHLFLVLAVTSFKSQALFYFTSAKRVFCPSPKKKWWKVNCLLFQQTKTGWEVEQERERESIVEWWRS